MSMRPETQKAAHPFERAAWMEVGWSESTLRLLTPFPAEATACVTARLIPFRCPCGRNC